MNQQQISRLVQEMARQNKMAVFNSKREANLTSEELAKNRKIREIIRLQTSKEEAEIVQDKKLQELLVKLQPGINELLRKNIEQKKADLKNAREKIRRERQEEIDRQNEENRRLMNKYFKDARKNLPQKGAPKNYSAYIGSIRPASRKALADYSGYNSSFQTASSRGHTNYNEYNRGFQAIQRKGRIDYDAYNKTLQPIVKK